MEELNIQEKTHTLVMEQRKKLKITGVSDIDSFDEKNITAFTNMGDISVGGENLHIIKIDVEQGELYLEGTIYSINYIDRTDKQEGFFAKLFR